MKEERDNLEDFVNQHRDEFPQAEPSADLWSRIQADLPSANSEQEAPTAPAQEPRQEKVIKLSTLYRAAAVLVLGLLSGYGIWGVDWGKGEGTVSTVDSTQIDNEQPQVVNNYYVSLKDISPELAEVEQFYSSQIQEKTNELQALQVNNQYLEDVEVLSEEMIALQKEVTTNRDNERVVEAMVENYRLRLELLENLLTEIKKEKEKKTDNGNTSNDVRL